MSWFQRKPLWAQMPRGRIYICIKSNQWLQSFTLWWVNVKKSVLWWNWTLAREKHALLQLVCASSACRHESRVALWKCRWTATLLQCRTPTRSYFQDEPYPRILLHLHCIRMNSNDKKPQSMRVTRQPLSISIFLRRQTCCLSPLSLFNIFYKVWLKQSVFEPIFVSFVFSIEIYPTF